MARLKGTTGALQEVDPNGAARVSIVGPYASDANGGRYVQSAVSGLLTTIAAFTTTAGHLAAFRNPSSTKAVVIDRFRAQFSMITDLTTLQALIFSLRRLSAYSALHNTGGAVLPTAVKKRSTAATSIMDGYCANAATAITGATVTATEPIVRAVNGEPSDGATVDNIPFDLLYDANRDGGPIILLENEALLVCNEVLMGAAGTMRMGIEVHYREMLAAEAAGL